jgi:anaerobic nitric oxide reductase transcription regulator
LVEEINLVGGSDLTVLITGETGVGKELVAQAIHAASPRADKPIISLNCAALPDTLVESELFGHVRGAFTGAMNDRRGKFELANGGTLFLDEVGELSLTVQAKLLRVLQSGQLQRLGSDKEHQVDVRLIAATNRDLAEEVRSGRYRADFYHRLSVYPLRVPALRDRGRDVLLLSGFFLEQNRSRMGLNSLRLNSRCPGSTAGLRLAGQRAGAGTPDRPQRAEGFGQLQGAAEDSQPECSGPGPAATAALKSAPSNRLPVAAALLISDLRVATENYQRRLISAPAWSGTTITGPVRRGSWGWIGRILGGWPSGWG